MKKFRSKKFFKKNRGKIVIILGDFVQFSHRKAMKMSIFLMAAKQKAAKRRSGGKKRRSGGKKKGG